MSHTLSHMLGQIVLPLRSVVDFFSPPAPAGALAHRVGSPAGLLLAKAPVLPAAAHTPSLQQTIQPAGIRLVGRSMLGQMGHAGPGLSAAQVLRSRRAQDGRIVISGRMRDVCAELDRLCDERG